MRPLICLLLPALLAAQAPDPVRGLSLDLRTELGSDPASGIHLAPRGCWDQLVLGATARTAPPARRRQAEATVEVWDWALPEPTPRERSFRLYLDALRDRLAKAMVLRPPTHQALDLGEIMQNDPSSPQILDLTRVRSLQDRFNRMPPSGSPVR